MLPLGTLTQSPNTLQCVVIHGTSSHYIGEYDHSVTASISPLYHGELAVTVPLMPDNESVRIETFADFWKSSAVVKSVADNQTGDPDKARFQKM